MASFNHVTLLGNVTRDPDLKKTQGGKTICTFGLAVNDRYKNASGEWVDDAMFIDVTFFGGQADVCGEYLSKGSPVLVTGKLKLEKWERDGVKHSRHTIIGDKMQMLGQRPSGDSTTQERPPARREESQVPPEDSIPF